MYCIWISTDKIATVLILRPLHNFFGSSELLEISSIIKFYYSLTIAKKKMWKI